MCWDLVSAGKYVEQTGHLQKPGRLPAVTTGLNSEVASMGLLAGTTDSDLLLLFS